MTNPPRINLDRPLQPPPAPASDPATPRPKIQLDRPVGDVEKPRQSWGDYLRTNGAAMALSPGDFLVGGSNYFANKVVLNPLDAAFKLAGREGFQFRFRERNVVSGVVTSDRAILERAAIGQDAGAVVAGTVATLGTMGAGPLLAGAATRVGAASGVVNRGRVLAREAAGLIDRAPFAGKFAIQHFMRGAVTQTDPALRFAAFRNATAVNGFMVYAHWWQGNEALKALATPDPNRTALSTGIQAAYAGANFLVGARQTELTVRSAQGAWRAFQQMEAGVRATRAAREMPGFAVRDFAFAGLFTLGAQVAYMWSTPSQP